MITNKVSTIKPLFRRKNFGLFAAAVPFAVLLIVALLIGLSYRDSTVSESLTVADYPETLDHTWRTTRDGYYDPSMNGVDWNQVHTNYRNQLGAVTDNKSFYQLLDKMVGELRDSHTNVSTKQQSELRERNLMVTSGASFYEVEGVPVVKSVRSLTSAASAGVKLGDVVLAIDGVPIKNLLDAARESASPNSTVRGRLIDVYRTVFGAAPEQTHRFDFKRANGEVYTARLTYQTMPIEAPVAASVLPSGFAYIRLQSFLVNRTSAEFNDGLGQVADFAPGLIIDVRGNNGGLTAELIRIVGRFSKEAVLVGIRRPRPYPLPAWMSLGAARLGLGPKTDEVWSVQSESAHYNRPVAVLVDGATASAAELFAAVMKETGRARIIGEQTCGCVLGVPSDGIAVRGGGKLKISNVEWLTSSKERLEGRGVTPDIDSSPTLADVQRGRDAAVAAAERVLAEQAR